MAKPQQILELEKIIGEELEEVSLDGIQNLESGDSYYSVGSNGEIVGLNLGNCLRHIHHKINFLSNLKSLFSLNLGLGELKDIKFLENLSNLVELSLASNQINDIDVLKNMPNLQLLFLSNNQITAIPEWLLGLDIPIYAKYVHLRKGIFVNGNPITQPPLEIIQQGNAAIKAYFDSLKKV